MQRQGKLLAQKYVPETLVQVAYFVPRGSNSIGRSHNTWNRIILGADGLKKGFRRSELIIAL